MVNRANEQEKSFFRSERFSQSNGCWYFVTRESTTEGPFTTKQDAQDAAARYASVIRSKMFSNEELSHINDLHIDS